jgi:hypothetical protein
MGGVMPRWINRAVPSQRERRSRGNTQRAKRESYRVEAIQYVEGRDRKIDEIVADLTRKYPRLSEANARRIVVEHWAKMERDHDVRNTVRSLDMGYDERAMLDRLNARLRDKLPDRLADRLPGGSSEPLSAISDAETAAIVERAARSLSAASAVSIDEVRSHLRRVMGR